jgi:hypothetical protein
MRGQNIQKDSQLLKPKTPEFQNTEPEMKTPDEHDPLTIPKYTISFHNTNPIQI